MLATAFTGYLMWFLFAGIGIAAYIARQRRLRAEDESIESWAAGKGYQPSQPGFASTPMRHADNAHVGPSFAVPVGGGEGELFAFTYTIGSGRDQRHVDTTLVQTDLAPGLPRFRVVPRHANDLPGGPWGDREMDLESVEFHDQHRLLVDHDGDREVLERVFDPETIVWFINLSADAPVVEYEGGTLVIAARRCCMTGAACDALLGQAEYMAGRLQAAGVAPQARGTA
jgi:hypothetical protein